MSHLITTRILAWQSAAMAKDGERIPSWLLIDLLIIGVGAALIVAGLWIGL
ncbi:hypothetical protein [Bradyrhizobium liaoningense]|uniref:hypothetical protein n=1 Tax=Bradyrhizobium liaoningense TaxID=43992 RepID=UPI001BABD150|nr:hypothetical protein [Bradyrhizobium liaoningense]MBR0907018.1 hypothetical protein [Bradyrhizobium liaoningense]